MSDPEIPKSPNPEIPGGRHEYPRSAFYLDCQSFELGDADPGDPVPVQMVIRTTEGVERFGQVWYHDFAGMQRKERVAIDWRHSDEELLGYLDRFRVKNGALHASGYLVPYGDDDRAHEIIHRARAGVPYESSIYFGGNGLKVEELGAGAKTKINGRSIQGPAVVFRSWPLRRVAIVPTGADGGTQTRLDDGGETITLTFLQDREEDSMSEDTQTQETLAQEEVGLLKRLARAVGLTKAEDPPEAKADQAGRDRKALEADIRQQLEGELKQKAEAQRAQFTEAFGDEAGLAYYAAGKSFEEAATEHHKQLSAKIEELERKLAAVDRGEEESAEFQSVDGEDKPTQAQAENHGGLAALVAFNAARMPGRNQRSG